MPKRSRVCAGRPSSRNLLITRHLVDYLLLLRLQIEEAGGRSVA